MGALLSRTKFILPVSAMRAGRQDKPEENRTRECTVSQLYLKNPEVEAVTIEKGAWIRGYRKGNCLDTKKHLNRKAESNIIALQHKEMGRKTGRDPKLHGNGRQGAFYLPGASECVNSTRLTAGWQLSRASAEVQTWALCKITGQNDKNRTQGNCAHSFKDLNFKKAATFSPIWSIHFNVMQSKDVKMGGHRFYHFDRVSGERACQAWLSLLAGRTHPSPYLQPASHQLLITLRDLKA